MSASTNEKVHDNNTMSPETPPLHATEHQAAQSAISPQSTGLSNLREYTISPQTTGISYTNTQDSIHENKSAMAQALDSTPVLVEKEQNTPYEGIEVIQPSPQEQYSNSAPIYQATSMVSDQKQPYNSPGAEQNPNPVGASKNHYAMAMPLRTLQQGPSPVDCPICGVREITAIEFVSGGYTHLSSVLCCLCLCLGCIPYMVSIFKNVEHKCGHCGALLAVWHRSGRTEVIVPEQS